MVRNKRLSTVEDNGQWTVDRTGAVADAFSYPPLQQWETQERQTSALKCQRGTHDQQGLAVVDVSALKRCQEEDADLRPVLSLKAWYYELSVFPHFTKGLKAEDPATITLLSLIGVVAQ